MALIFNAEDAKAAEDSSVSKPHNQKCLNAENAEVAEDRAEQPNLSVKPGKKTLNKTE